MRRWLVPALVAASLGALTLACHGGSLLRGEQYGYRDAAHYYYPLHQRVQQEWSSGRWPLWDPSENAGMPLLGNPTAAVLYPAKLIFAVAPYPLAARLYIVAHGLFAFASMLILLRSWGMSGVGSALGGLAYAFGAPVLFQSSNVIYLVGAAWAPLGMLAADRWVRLGDRRAILGLAVVLAMETLGGDPETAYLTGFFAACYAVGRSMTRRSDDPAGRHRWWVAPIVILAIIVAWSAATLAMAAWGVTWRAPASANGLVAGLPWIPLIRPSIVLGWVAAGLWIVGRWQRSRTSGRPSVLAPALLGLVASALLAVLLTAAQLLPVLEFAAQSGRVVGEGSHEIFSFSLPPIRAFEFLWPNASGTSLEGNHAWLEASGWCGKPAKVWVPSLYVGGLTVVLALASVRLRGGPPWRSWIAAFGLFSLLASLGEYASPLWIGRHWHAVASVIGPLDPVDVPVLRADGKLRDGDGGVYWTMATFLPGFRQFRFPSKLLTFTSMTLSALAGQGWDALISGDSRVRRRVIWVSSTLLSLTFVALLASSAWGESFLAGLAGKPRESLGPVDVQGAYRDLRWGLAQGGLTFAVGLGLVAFRVRNGWPSAAIALVVMTGDLALANAGLVVTVPQRLFDETPEVLEILSQSERDHPEDGPFRVHRMPSWEPVGWPKTPSAGRTREFVTWERRTLQPKYGIPLGVQYTMTLGVAELHDYQAFFRPSLRDVDATLARTLGTSSDRGIVVYPRRAFDLWNTRYFVLPSYPNKWDDRYRGFAAFLDRTEPLHPSPGAFHGAGGRAKYREWIETNDFQVRRNLSAGPRAWIVHRAVELQNNLDPDGIEEILFSEEDRWRDPSRVVHDPRSVVWLEAGGMDRLGHFLDGRAPGRDETVRLTKYESDRVELQATLERPGILVLADVFYPGWTLTIDGQAAPIERANRMMRAAAVDRGEHALVFTYRPASFRAGLIVSGLTLAVLVPCGLLSLRWSS